MPRATIDRDERFRFDLQTCPPDGFVELRKLSYHEMMQRIDLMGRMVYETTNRRQRRGQKARPQDETMRSMLESANAVVMEFEFKNSILDHNLEDKDGNLLDFSNPLTLRTLDPRIGAEIGRHIDTLNQVDDDDFLPLENAPTSSSQNGTTLPSENTEETEYARQPSGSESEG